MLDESTAAAIDVTGRVAGVAHDLDSVLAVVLLRTELAARPDRGGPALQADLDVIRRAVAQGRQLTAQLRRAGRGGHAEPERLDLDQVLDAVGPLLDALAGEGVAVERPRRGAPPVWAPRADLEQVALNLVANAGDALAGAGRLVVAVDRCRRAGRDGVELVVADTGPGMDEATAARALERGFTTKAPGVGSGTGLATVADVARRAGGAVRIDSRPGRGTTVAVWLPAAGPVAGGPPAPVPVGGAAGAR